MYHHCWGLNIQSDNLKSNKLSPRPWHSCYKTYFWFPCRPVWHPNPSAGWMPAGQQSCNVRDSGLHRCGTPSKRDRHPSPGPRLATLQVEWNLWIQWMSGPTPSYPVFVGSKKVVPEARFSVGSSVKIPRFYSFQLLITGASFMSNPGFSKSFPQTFRVSLSRPCLVCNHTPPGQ